MSETRVLVDGLGFPESTRWRDGRAWLCNRGAGEVLAVSGDGEREVVARLDGPTRAAHGEQDQLSTVASAEWSARVEDEIHVAGR